MILMLVNDDGIEAKGIRALCEAAVEAGHRVYICAPEEEKSAASHSITLQRSLKARRVSYPGAACAYAVDGTPADCARLGVYLFRDVDAVISGVNNGSNMGGACVYSGTIAAAMEASMAGTPALAASLCAYNTHEYDAAARVTVRVAEWMIDHPLPKGALYNLNVPALPYDEILGVRAATLAPTYLEMTSFYEDPQAPCGDGIAYAHQHYQPPEQPEGTDVWLTHQGYASLTKLTWDFRMNAEPPEADRIRL